VIYDSDPSAAHLLALQGTDAERQSAALPFFDPPLCGSIRINHLATIEFLQRLVAGQGLRRQQARTRGNSLVCATCCVVSQLNQQCHAASLAYGVSHALTNASI
jgi:hypothetical protein